MACSAGVYSGGDVVDNEIVITVRAVTPSLSVFSTLRTSHAITFCGVLLVTVSLPGTSGAGMSVTHFVAMRPTLIVVGWINAGWARIA
jgi:uncharacterized membrane protein